MLRIYSIFNFAKLLKLSEITIPIEKLTTQYCRSSGPGGQHVNKTNSKAEIRFNVQSADWIDDHVKKNLFKIYSNYINKEGELILTSQQSRTQEQNLADAVYRLRQIILECSQPDKNEFVIPPPTENMQVKRIQSKRNRSDIKKTRQRKDDW